MADYIQIFASDGGSLHFKYALARGWGLFPANIAINDIPLKLNSLGCTFHSQNVSVYLQPLLCNGP